ncbi:MSEP-CTERM sorting domain-containing protein [Arenicella xantha]|uniref:Putative secreted protein with MSEP-CTERM motif n=1 Tax=Arenicella xantha TaxID=644221 RepID=A0A395JPQ9_9GAMM|nr:MSEP-CTERM sorting domain-containing protein [Arenicella xantha]RBP53589.1 putative secreted protein with MSEP-CTERM motif [Arenicella xantha]
MNTVKNRSSQPHFWPIVWAMIIPQVALLLVNIRGWTLIQGETVQSEQSVAIAILLAELLILALVCSYVRIRSTLNTARALLWLSLLALVVHISYMICVPMFLEDAIPNAIQPWILNPEGVAYWNISLFMPGAFLALYVFTKQFFGSFTKLQSNLIVVVTTVGVPLFWYLSMSVLQPVWLGQYSVALSIVFATTMVVVFLAGIIRLFDSLLANLYPSGLTSNDSTLNDTGENDSQSSKKAINSFDLKYTLLVTLLGIAAPLGGLWLNLYLPFPADFQSTGVYVFTLINGLVLLIKPIGIHGSPIRLFLRCITLPFIGYFFLVFLPFLPLSLIAILAVGAGFLMLTPLALGLFQARITLTEFSLAKQRVGSFKAVAIGVLGLAVLPGYFTTQALLDKHALDTSLRYFYSHDVNATPLTESQIRRSADTLVQLRDRKIGIQLPFISGAYNSIVFGSLVLSDNKIDRMHQLLTGEKLAAPKRSFFGQPSRSSRSFRRNRITPPLQQVDLSEFSVKSKSAETATIQVELANRSSRTHSLYVGELTIPEGTFVTGLRLKIGDTWETGRVFDRKTAIWVFQKITEVRRDPALLYYTSATTAELRVYPFPAQGIREVEIDVQIHPHLNAQITLGDQAIDLNPSITSAAVVANDGTVLVDSPADVAFTREDYLHFILDYSSKARSTSRQYAKSIVETIEQTGVKKYRISAANISSNSNTDGDWLTSTDLDEITAYIDDIELTRVGGLWLTQAFAREARARINTRTTDDVSLRPRFVVISQTDKLETPDASGWLWQMPDVTDWYVLRNNTLSTRQFSHHTKSSASVIALKDHSTISILPSTVPSLYSIRTKAPIELYNPAKSEFTPILTTSETAIATPKWAKWAELAQLWTHWRTVRENPATLESERRALLDQSRALNLLIPTTSLIVVESASQWEILARKEKQSINNHSGLDFEEEQQTPEPVWWLLLAALLIFIYHRDKRTRRA